MAVKEQLEKPCLSAKEILALAKPFSKQLKNQPVFLMAIRNYFREGVREEGQDSKWIYGDALFLYSPSCLVSFHVNTDPTVKRRKKVTERGTPILKAGCYMVHRFDNFRSGKQVYAAIMQRAGNVDISRDGEDAPDVISKGMDILKGGLNLTHPEGAQCVHPMEWDPFLLMVKDQFRRYHARDWSKAVIPYILLDSVEG